MIGLRPSDRVLALIAPVLLVTVALTQITLTHAANLTSWKGGGFGMFATVDRINERFVLIEVTTETGERRSVNALAIELDPGQHHLVRRATAMPDRTTLHRLATELLQLDWVERLDGSGRSVLATTRRSPGERGLEVTAVDLSVWSPAFDPADLHLSAERLASVTVVRR